MFLPSCGGSFPTFRNASGPRAVLLCIFFPLCGGSLPAVCSASGPRTAFVFMFLPRCGGPLLLLTFYVGSLLLVFCFTVWSSFRTGCGSAFPSALRSGE